jgi:hypothetical protein
MRGLIATTAGIRLITLKVVCSVGVVVCGSQLSLVVMVLLDVDRGDENDRWFG